MFITALIFMLGILSYFNDCAQISAAILSVCALFVLFKKYISYRYILLWIFVFYFGFFNSYFRIKTTDDLFSQAPANAEITGRITSIPVGNTKNKVKFFFDVEKINNENYKGKTLVSLFDGDENFDEFQIGDKFIIKGKQIYFCFFVLLI